MYDAVGASDADGYGSSFPCLPYVDCPNGMGYPQIAARALTAQGFTVTVQNLGIPTSVIGPDFETLGQQYNHTILGNFITQEAPFVRVQPMATLVTIFAGGNEINTITAALGGGAGASNQLGYIDAQVSAFGADYVTLLAVIRGRAPAARIVVLNVPNLAGLPFLAGQPLPQRQAAQRAAVGMSKLVNSLPNVNVVDLLCDTRSYAASIYSSDGFHPNDAGYAYIASEVVRATTLTAYPASQNSCASMTIVPNP